MIKLLMGFHCVLRGMVEIVDLQLLDLDTLGTVLLIGSTHTKWSGLTNVSRKFVRVRHRY